MKKEEVTEEMRRKMVESAIASLRLEGIKISKEREEELKKPPQVKLRRI